MTTMQKKSSSKKKVTASLKLTSRDINMLSAFAQQTKLPSEYLLKYAKRLKISSDAYGVLEELVKRPNAYSLGKPSAMTKSSDERIQAARVFQRWASGLKKEEKPASEDDIKRGAPK